MYDWEFDNPELQGWIQLHQAAHVMNRILDIALAKDETTTAQMEVLGVLNSAKGSMTLGEIATALFGENHGVSAKLTRMHKAGLVRKTRSSKDQRVVRIRMSPDGEKLLRQGQPNQGGSQCHVCSGSDPQPDVGFLGHGYWPRINDYQLRAISEGCPGLPDVNGQGWIRVGTPKDNAFGVLVVRTILICDEISKCGHVGHSVVCNTGISPPMRIHDGP